MELIKKFIYIISLCFCIYSIIFGFMNEINIFHIYFGIILSFILFCIGYFKSYYLFYLTITSILPILLCSGWYIYPEYIFTKILLIFFSFLNLLCIFQILYNLLSDKNNFEKFLYSKELTIQEKHKNILLKLIYIILFFLTIIFGLIGRNDCDCNKKLPILLIIIGSFGLLDLFLEIFFRHVIFQLWRKFVIIVLLLYLYIIQSNCFYKETCEINVLKFGYIHIFLGTFEVLLFIFLPLIIYPSILIKYYYKLEEDFYIFRRQPPNSIIQITQI